jgi:competence protein ComEC
LDGALIGRTIDNAIITSFQDERPAAQITWRKLRQHASSLTQAETGMHGTLGEFRWQILSPHRGASEAQDSNDGSVTMLFRGEGLVLATLADLGERGQRRLVDESANWLGGGFGATPVIVKVAHHGSADQFPGFYSALGPELALVSDGVGNDYGHPTERALKILQEVGAQIHRTDLEGSIAVVSTAEGLRVYGAGRG